MLENNRLLLACCVVCGAIGAYLVSIYVFVIVVVACVVLLLINHKGLEQVASATKAFSFPVPSWIKTIITALMNSYHLSKPLEHEPSARRGSPYSPNIPIPRRPSCRSNRYTCLDENTDYVNRRNGIGPCNTSSSFDNSYSNSLHGFRRQSNFSDTDNPSKIEDYCTPQTSPWARRQNYSGSDYINVRRVQTVAGPLLASSGLPKRKSNDFGLLVDASSPGLASRIVQYREEGMSSSSSVWTHQPQYSSPGQFPMVHLNHSPSSLPVLSPMSSQKASRRSVRVKIAPPDPLGSRLYPLSTKNTIYTTVQTDHSTKSVLETLKEISRKRIHSQLEDNDDDAAKRQKRSVPSDLSITLANDTGETDNVSKRLREESPRQLETSPPVRPTKRIRNNEILSSLSSSRKLLLSGGVKRKTHNLDWSRCSTPVQGKQQKTTGEDRLVSPSPELPISRAKALLAASELASGQTSEGENLRRSGQRSRKTSENEKNTRRLSLAKTPLPGKETQKFIPKAASLTPKAGKNSGTVIVSDTPWQKDSPFVSVSSPDDVIDDVSALEEKREEDRRSRLMSMMAVISGGEPPVKISETVASQSVTMNSIIPTANISKTTFSLGNNSLLQSAVTCTVTPNISPEKTLFVASAIPSGWSSNAGILTEATPVASLLGTTQTSQPTTSTTTSVLTSTTGTTFPSSLPASSPMFSFGNTVSSSTDIIAQKTQDSTVAPISFTTPSTSSTFLQVAPVFGSSSTPVSTQQTMSASSPPVFGSTAALFGSKASSTDNTIPFNNQNQQPVCTATTSVSSTSSHSFGFTPVSNSQVSFGEPAASSSPLTSTPVATSVTAALPVTSTPASSVFQLRPAVSGLGQENNVSSSSGVFSTSVPTTSAAQANSFNKTLTFGAAEKPTQNTQFNTSTPAPSSTVVFGPPASTSAVADITPAFTFGATATSTTPTSGLQTKSGIFSFGNSSNPSQSAQAASNSGNKSVFGSAAGSFGQPLEATAPHNVASNQLVNSQPATSKVGGFKFDLSPGKSVFSTQSNLASGSSPNVFGNPVSAAGSNEPKPFAFVSGKTVENPFALNVNNSHSPSIVSQIQTPVHPFGSLAMPQKTSDGGQIKESLFSFGGSSTVGTGFPARQTGGFSVQSTTTSTTTTTSSGFSFSSASTGGFSQPTTGVGSFSLQPAVTSTSNFSTPAPSSITTASTTVANSAFSFGSTAPNQTPQTNMFAFGASTNTTEPQSGGMFGFGCGNSMTPSSSTGLFGQSVAPAAPAQLQAVPPLASAQASVTGPAPTQPFQFGTSNGTPQLSGTFSFGASPAANTTAGGYPGGGSFQVNTGGFGAGPAMFSIGSGSTAPRTRNSRTRRTK